jgi:hypothetical protein
MGIHGNQQKNAGQGTGFCPPGRQETRDGGKSGRIINSILR